MENRVLLSLDMSTTCTGFAVFDMDSRALIFRGVLKPSTKGGVAKMSYPKQQLTKMIDLSKQILDLIAVHKPTAIVIEEIAGSKNRLGQKTLDGLHFIVAYFLELNGWLSLVNYYDVTGADGWRTHLKLRLSEADKLHNKEAVKLNKKLAPSQRIPKVGPKHLACRYANAHYGVSLNCDTAETDGDIADAICIGAAFLSFRCARTLL